MILEDNVPYYGWDCSSCEVTLVNIDYVSHADYFETSANLPNNYEIKSSGPL